jgi:hypothetical protein
MREAKNKFRYGTWSRTEAGTAHLLPASVLPALAALTPPLQVQVLHQVLPKDCPFKKDDDLFFSPIALHQELLPVIGLEK